MQPKWYEAGAKDYGWSPLALTTLEFLLLGFLEVKRYQGFKKTGQARRPSPNTLHRPGTVSAVPAGLRPAGSCSSASCPHHCAREGCPPLQAARCRVAHMASSLSLST